MIPNNIIQSALYQVLTSNAELMGELTGGVWDEVPEDATKPYLVLQDIVTNSDNDQTSFGYSTVATLHIWSDYHGNSQSVSIAAKVVNLLDHQPLTLAGYKHIVTRFEFIQSLRDPEKPNLRHVPVRFRILTEAL